MDRSVVLAIVAVVAIALVALLLVVVLRTRQRKQLRDRFGPEYDRAIARTGDRKQAELDLRHRVQEHDQLPLRPLTREAQDRYRAEWRDLQVRFVDAPDRAIEQADDLLERVMRSCGYPVETDPEHRADLVAVDHPDLVGHWREARRIRQANRAGIASTDDLREAVVRYRALFEGLIEGGARQEAGR